MDKEKQNSEQNCHRQGGGKPERQAERDRNYSVGSSGNAEREKERNRFKKEKLR